MIRSGLDCYIASFCQAYHDDELPSLLRGLGGKKRPQRPALGRRRGPMKTLCEFHYDHEPDTLLPRGRKCNARATQEIYWADGRMSLGCDAHGLKALDELARALVVRIVRRTAAKERA